MKLPFFHIMAETKYTKQLNASYIEGYAPAVTCCYSGQYKKMTEDEKELRILELSHRNEVLTEKLLRLDHKTNEKLLSLDHNMKDRQYYFGDASDLWRIFYSEKAPCSKCSYRYSCASKHRACTDLAHYLRTGEIRETVREPTPEWYDVIIDLKLEEIQK